VQVAAFSNHESAEKLRARLKELGFDARITNDAAQYRVRVGRYATREAADSTADRMKEQHVDGYVTAAEPKR
jgi:cell division protein FtsN